MTVSRVLREPSQVSAQTYERIKKALMATGYSPNKQAGFLASGRSRIVAAIIPNIANSIFSETIQGLSEVLQQRGLELLLASSNYSLEREELQLRAMIGWGPAAVIVTGRRHTRGALQILRQAKNAGTPVLEIWDQRRKPFEFAQIGFDHQAVGQAVARHLLELGHSSLVYVESSVLEDYRASERRTAFINQAKLAGARTQVVRAPTGNPLDAGRQILLSLCQEKKWGFSAMAFANDQLACGALMAARSIGIDIPRQLAMIGFGDFPIGAHLDPALSTVRPPRRDIGYATAKAVLQALDDKLPALSQVLPWELIARASTIAQSLEPEN